MAVRRRSTASGLWVTRTRLASSTKSTSDTTAATSQAIRAIPSVPGTPIRISSIR